MITLSPFQSATVARATRHVPRDVAEGRSGPACLQGVLGQIEYPARAERDAARALVQAAYPGVALDHVGTTAAWAAADLAEIDRTTAAWALLRVERARGAMLDAMTDDARHAFLAAERTGTPQ